MSSTDAYVSFGAETGPFTAGVAEVKAQLASLRGTVPNLGSAFSNLGSQGASAFRNIAQGSKEAVEGVTHMLGPIQMMRDALGGVGEALIAAFAVKEMVDFSRNMGETAEKVLHTAQTFGLTASEVQHLNAEATAAGVPAEALTMAMTRMDRSFAAAKAGGERMAANFKALGIDVHGSYTQMQLLQKAIEGFANLPPGLPRVALATQLLGRNIQAIGPIINATKDQLAEWNAAIEASGAVNDEAIARGGALADANNQVKLAFQGLNNVLTVAFAPVLRQISEDLAHFIEGIVRSYNEGGVARQVFDTVAGTMNALRVIIEEVSNALGDLFIATGNADGKLSGLRQTVEVLGIAFTGFSTTVRVVLAAADYAINQTNAYFENLGDTVRNLVGGLTTGNWAAFNRDAKANQERIARDAQDFSNRLMKIRADGLRAIGQLGGAKVVRSPLPKEGTGTSDELPDKVKKAKAAKAPHEASEDLAEWKHELEQKLAADTSFGHDDLATTLAFWQSKLAIAESNGQAEIAKTKAGTKARTAAEKDAAKEVRAVQDEIARAQRAYNKEHAELALSQAQTDLNIQKGALTTGLDLAKQHAAQQTAIIDEQEKSGELTKQQALAKKAAIDLQMFQLEKEEVDKEYAIDLGLLEKKKQIGDLTIVEVQRIQNEIETLTAQHNQRLAQMDAAQATKQVQDAMRAKEAMESTGHGWVDPIVNSWASGIEGMIEGTQNFRTAVQGVFRSLVSDIIGHIAKMVQDWIVNHIFMSLFYKGQVAVQTATTAVGQATQTGLVVAGQATQTAATVAGQTAQTVATATGSAARRGITILDTMKTIAAHAAKAAAGAYAALASVPFIGPILGAAAAAATFAAVMAFGALASAEGGWGSVPEDQLAMVHKEEMVLPASIAAPLRESLSGGYGIGGVGGTAEAAAGPGAQARESTVAGPSFHYNPQVTNPEPDLMRALDRQGRDFLDWVGNHARNGRI